MYSSYSRLDKYIILSYITVFNSSNYLDSIREPCKKLLLKYFTTIVLKITTVIIS